jgi:hypothetical protein
MRISAILTLDIDEITENTTDTRCMIDIEKYPGLQGEAKKLNFAEITFTFWVS